MFNVLGQWLTDAEYAEYEADCDSRLADWHKSQAEDEGMSADDTLELDAELLLSAIRQQNRRD